MVRDKLGQHTCPWWFLFAFDNPLRRLYQNPRKILSPLISGGERILDLGCGMGFLTIPAAELVGEKGQVVAVDLQRRMLDGLIKRADKLDLQDRIQAQLTTQRDIGVDGRFDLVLAFWMVHEVHDRESFLSQIWKLLGSGGKFLVAEPLIHVTKADFMRTSSILEKIGFCKIDEPDVGFSRAIIVGKE